MTARSKTPLRAGAGFALAFAVTLLAHASGGCTSHGVTIDRLCEPSAFVFCRCDDDGPGTKQCAADGMSFSVCGSCGAAPSAQTASDAGPRAPADAGLTSVTNDVGSAPLDASSPALDAKCATKLAVLAGSAAANDEFLYASVFDGAKFDSFSSTGVPLRSQVAVHATASGAMGVYLSRNGWLVSTTFENGAWQTPIQIEGAQSDSAPALATWGATLVAVYHGTDGAYYATTFDASSGWDGAPDAIGAPTSPPITSGSAPAAASAGTPGVPGAAIVLGFTDDSGGIYRQEWHGTSWFDTPIKSPSVIAANRAPALVAMTGGPYDLLSLYVGSGDNVLHDATRTVSDHGNVWSNPGLVDPTAVALEGPSVTALAGGRAIVLYLDTRRQPFYSLFDPTETPNWTPPAELVPGNNPTVASTPSVVADLCGGDAAVAYAEQNGVVAVTRLVNGTWTPPVPLDGLSNATYAAILETP